MTTDERLARMLAAPAEVIACVDRVLAAPVNVIANVHMTLDGDNPLERSVTAKEAADRLHVSRPTVYRMVKSKELETVMVHGVPRIWLPSVLRIRPKNTMSL